MRGAGAGVVVKQTNKQTNKSCEFINLPGPGTAIPLPRRVSHADMQTNTAAAETWFFATPTDFASKIDISYKTQLVYTRYFRRRRAGAKWLPEHFPVTIQHSAFNLILI
jgi:hypothetical protein